MAMRYQVSATSETLLDQAGDTADIYLGRAIEAIDARLGAGYAAKHPELIGAFMRTAAQDFDTAIAAKVALQSMADLVEAMRAQKTEVSVDLNEDTWNAANNLIKVIEGLKG